MTRHKLLGRIIWTSAALLALVLAFLVSVIFLNPSSVGNRDFLWNFNFWASMWAMLFVLVLVLAVVLARYLIRLFFEYQAGYPGSRIKTKLVLTFVIFALFPALIMAFLAFGLINQNLTTWVSAPSEQLLSASGTISQDYYAEKERRLLAEARDLSKAVRDGSQSLEQVFSRAHSLGFEGMALIEPSGKAQGTFGRFPTPSPPEVDRQVEQGAVLLPPRSGREHRLSDRRPDLAFRCARPGLDGPGRDAAALLPDSQQRRFSAQQRS